MKILLVYPESPSTFWSFRNALKFISKKSSEPPLGLLTIAAMLPEKWEKKLIDMNVAKLKDADLLWADYVFLSGMDIHRDSFKNIVKRCNYLSEPVVAGGPMVTQNPGAFMGIDHFVLNEAELTLPMFLEDLQQGTARHVYQNQQFPDISETPIPDWRLLDLKKYASMSVQYSRGCPYNCDFCNITVLNGRVPRTKDTDQFINELEQLFLAGWRGNVFIVDDNFIGNKRKLKQELLPELIDWSRQRKYPFKFNTEVTINLAEDSELIELMVQAGFDSTFIGIETPNEGSLAECGKKQNLQLDMVAAVKKLHNAGLRVSAGFIIGFDSDPADIFERQIDFIQKSGVVTAMVGLLNAPTGTSLFNRMKKEKRLLNEMSGNNMDGTINFVPKMNYQKLILGYRKILSTVYSPSQFYTRVIAFLDEYKMPAGKKWNLSVSYLQAFFKANWILGICGTGKRYYWKLLSHSLIRYPQKFALAVTLAIYGYHFRKISEQV